MEWTAGEPGEPHDVTLEDFETLELPIQVLSRSDTGMHYAMHLGLSVVGAASNLSDLYTQCVEFIRTQKTTLVTLGERELAWRFVCFLYGFVAGLLTLLVFFHG